MSGIQFPRFISHEPTGKDLFEGKPQEKIAKNIADQIQSPHSKKLIGIDGAWGSGKSNVISMLESEVKDTHHLFIYDAWGHQEDTQRKSFLEGLTTDLIQKNLLPNKTVFQDLAGRSHKDSWRERLKFLLSRKTTVNHSEVPEFSAGVFWIIAILAFTPLLAMTSSFLDESSIPDSYVFFAKIAFSLLLLIVAIAWWLLYSLCTWTNPKKLLVNLFYIYKGKNISFTSYEAISNEEASVTEFKQWMKDISEDLKKKSNKGLVIAFDNMDRLPPERIKELWSSIHTFFAEGHSEYENIWVIVPFDRAHLQKAFKKLERDGAANQFINKSFSIVYRISPPILTDWKRYFKHLFNEAFGNTEDSQVNVVVSIFDLLKQHFTPRDIIVFINDLVALKKLWGDEITLKYMALFVLVKSHFESYPITKIINKNYTEKVEKYFTDEDKLLSNMAALVFNVPVTRAFQVVLHREIELSLREGNLNSVVQSRKVTPLNKLALHEHFLDVLEDVVGKSEFDTASAVAVLDKLEVDKIESQKEKQQLQAIWDELLRRELESEITSVKFTDTHETLLNHISDEQWERLANSICNALSKLTETAEAEEEIGSVLFRELGRMQEAANTLKTPLIISEIFPSASLKPTVFLGYLSEAKSDYGQYKVSCDPEKFDEYCSELIPEDMLHVAPIKYLKDDEDYAFEKTKEKLVELKNSGGINSENFNDFLVAQKAVIQEKPIQPFEEQLLYTLLTAVTPEAPGYYDLLAMRLSYTASFDSALIHKILPVRQQTPDPTAPQLTLSDEKTVSEVASVIEYYGNYGDLLEALPSWPQPLLVAVLASLTNHSVGTSRMNVVSVLKNYEAIFTSLGVSEEEFLNQLNGWKVYAKKEILRNNIAETITSPLFFKHASKVNLPITEHLISQMIKRLDGLSVDEWKTILANEGDFTFKVLAILLDSKHVKQMPGNAVTAYKGLLSEMAKGERGLIDEFFNVFYDGINKNKLKATLKDIRDEYGSHTEITKELFLHFAEPLISHAKLEEKSGEVTRRILTPVINDDDCRQFVIDHGDYFVPLINQSGDDAENLKDMIRQLCEGSEDDELKAFAKRIKATAK